MVKLFDKWDIDDVEIKDLGVKRYVNIEPVLIVHTGGKHARQQFNKSELNIVERLINKLMLNEGNTGKKTKAMKSVEESFDIIHDRTEKNPVQVLVTAIENAGPREETVRLKYGGISVPKAVDTAPQRRVDLALQFIARGAQRASYKSKTSLAEALANEIIAAADYDVKAFSIGKKEERERVARAAR